ncbi:hypothetical protein, partial [Thermomonas sp.]|uniref:hypothetical protein n=1 Tax=Thermomonas sp. TaxID=1971895 RepID=UPI0026228B7B
MAQREEGGGDIDQGRHLENARPPPVQALDLQHDIADVADQFEGIGSQRQQQHPIRQFVAGAHPGKDEVLAKQHQARQHQHQHHCLPARNIHQPMGQGRRVAAGVDA